MTPKTAPPDQAASPKIAHSSCPAGAGARGALAGPGASIFLALATALAGGHIVLTKIGPHGRLVSKVAQAYEIISWQLRAR